MAVRVDTLIDAADRALRRQERAILREIDTHLTQTYRRLNEQIGRAYRAAAAEIPADASRAFREARAVVMARQVETAMEALRVDQGPLPGELRERLVAAYREGAENAEATLARYRGERVPFPTGQVNLEAVELLVERSRERLFRHGPEAQRRIRQAVVDGLVRGRGYRVVAREIRHETAVLQIRAEAIARTELGSAMTDARLEHFEREGVPLVQWVAAEDERTCEYCGARHGNVYNRRDVTLPAHVNCRCALAPMRREWIEEDLADTDWWRESQSEVDELMQAQGIKPNYQATPFERAAGRPAAKAVWTPRSGWRR